MKLYRVSIRNAVESHFGYTFHATRKEAERIKREFLADQSAKDEPSAEVEAVEVKPTKAGILAALNRYAGHADNG